MDDSIVPKLSASEALAFSKLEEVIRMGQKTFVEVGSALTDIRDRRLYRVGFSSFEEYCQTRWGWSARRGNQLIAAAEFVQNLSPTLAAAIPDEKSARKLAELSLSDAKEIVRAIKKNGEPISPKNIEEKSAGIDQKVGTQVPSARIIAKTEPVIELDKTGWPIPPKILPLWHRSEEVALIMTEIGRIKRKLTQVEDDKDILFAPINFSSAQAELHRAWSDIQNALPYAVCSVCQGQAPERCTLCKGRGLISKYLWDTVVPKETKAIREKARAAK